MGAGGRVLQRLHRARRRGEQFLMDAKERLRIHGDHRNLLSGVRKRAEQNRAGSHGENAGMERMRSSSEIGRGSITETLLATLQAVAVCRGDRLPRARTHTL